MPRTLSQEAPQKLNAESSAMQSLQKPKMFWWIILAVLAAILLIGWVVWTYQKTITEAENLSLEQNILALKKQVLQDETSNWQTYKNEEYGFEFKYPRQWYFKTAPDGSATILNYTPADLGGGRFTDEQFKITFSLRSKDENDDIQESEFDVDIIEDKEIIYNQIIFRRQETTNNSWKSKNIKSSTLRGDTRYVFYSYSRLESPRQEEFIRLFDRIASTFRFLDEKNTETEEVVDFSHWGCLLPEIEDKITVDVETFKKLSHCYAKDKNYIYAQVTCGQDCMATVLKNKDMDIETIEVIQGHYLQDKSRVYYSSVSTNIDADSLTVLTKGGYGYYAKDYKNVYFKGKAIQEADLETFEVIQDQFIPFAKDKKHVYYEGIILQNADPQTAEILEFPKYLKDKNHVWYGGKLVEGADPETFKP